MFGVDLRVPLMLAGLQHYKTNCRTAATAVRISTTLALDPRIMCRVRYGFSAQLKVV